MSSNTTSEIQTTDMGLSAKNRTWAGVNMVEQTQRPVKPTETSELFLVRGTLPNAARFSNCATIHKVVFDEKSTEILVMFTKEFSKGVNRR